MANCDASNITQPSVDIIHHLQKWVTAFSSSLNDLPVDTSLIDQRLCRGKLAAIWPFLMCHVRPLPEVRKIRRLLNSESRLVINNTLQFEHQKVEKQIRRRDELADEVKSKNVAIKTQTIELTRLYDAIQKEDFVCYVLQAKTAILKNDILQYNSIVECLKCCFEVLFREVNSSPAIQYYDRTKPNGKVTLSTECMKTIGDHLSTIYNTFINVVMAKLDGNNDSIRSVCWEDLENTFERYPVKEIIDSLFTLIDERLEVIETCINSLDLERDMELLQFQFDPFTGFVDKSKNPKAIRTIVHLLQQGKRLVVEKAMKSEEHHKHRLVIQQENETNLETASKKIDETAFLTPEKKFAIMELMESQLSLASANEELKVLTDINKSLETDLEKALLHQHHKKFKFMEIERSNQLLIKKQSVVRSLITSNINSHKKWNAKTDKINLLANEITTILLPSFQRSMNYPAISNEMQLFAVLSEVPLTVTKLKNKFVLTSTLNINQIPRNPLSLYKSVGLIAEKTTENLLFDLMEMQIMCSGILHFQQKREKDLKRPQFDIKNLRLNLHSKYQNKMKTLQSARLQEESVENNWTADYNLLLNCLKCWWQQDIADVILPYTVDNLNFKEWTRKWITQFGLD